MTYKIMSSRVPPGFDVAVAAHALEMRNWTAHMARVEEDKKNNVPREKAHMAYQRPTASPLVAASINEKFEPDFTIIPDGPTRDESLVQKKQELISQVTVAEQNLLEAVSPANKRRLLDIQESDVRAADAARMAPLIARYQEISAQFAATSAALRKSPDDADLMSQAEALGAESHILVAQFQDPENTVHKDRLPADKKLLDDQKSRREKIALVQRWAAQNHSDIEDLTAEKIDTWKFPVLPKI